MWLYSAVKVPECCGSVVGCSAGYSPPLSTQMGACRPGLGTGIPAPWWTQTGLKLKPTKKIPWEPQNFGGKAIYGGCFAAGCALPFRLHTQNKVPEQRKYRRKKTYSRSLTYTGASWGDSVVVKFSVWRPYRQLTGDILANARNSRIKLNSISLEASATPPPVNPEVSAPGVRRFIVKGNVYDVNFLMACAFKQGLDSMHIYYSCWKSEWSSYRLKEAPNIYI